MMDVETLDNLSRRFVKPLDGVLRHLTVSDPLDGLITRKLCGIYVFMFDDNKN